MIKKIKKIFWAIFLLPDNVLTFFSGIFVAGSVNILTSQIPQSVFSAGWTFFLASILLMIIACVLLWWSVIIRPVQCEYNESFDIRENMGALDCWYNFINRKTYQAYSTRIKLIVFFLLIVVLFIFSIILLMFPENIKIVVNCITDKISKVEG